MRRLNHLVTVLIAIMGVAWCGEAFGDGEHQGTTHYYGSRWGIQMEFAVADPPRPAAMHSTLEGVIREIAIAEELIQFIPHGVGRSVAVREDGEIGLNFHVHDDEGVTTAEELEPVMQQLAAHVEAALQGIVDEYADLDEAERQRRRRQVDAELEEMPRIQMAAESIRLARGWLSAEASERLASELVDAHWERQRAQAELGALEHRLRQVQQQVDFMQQSLDQSIQQDEILGLLREAVEVREQEYERAQKLVEAGHTSDVPRRQDFRTSTHRGKVVESGHTSDVPADVRLRLNEARIRAAEREEYLRLTQAETLSALQEEMQSIMAERLRLAAKLAELPSLELRGAPEQQRRQLAAIANLVAPRADDIHQVRRELRQHELQLHRQRLGLLLSGIELVDEGLETQPLDAADRTEP